MPKKILVAEDDLSLQEIFQLLLKKRGYEVELIPNPGIVKDYSLFNADLFLLDLHLSGFSGSDICRRLKSDPSTREIPVIMISADPNIHTLAKSSGADESIEKPFDTKAFLSVISAHLTEK